MEKDVQKKLLCGGKARMVFRPLLFCAVGLAFGIFLYGKIRFGGFALTDVLFLFLLILAALFPLSLKRMAAVLVAVFVFAGVGALSVHLYTLTYLKTEAEAEYALSGTVQSVTIKDGYSYAVLTDLYFDGNAVSGKCRITLGDEVRTGDILSMTASITPYDLSDFRYNPNTRNAFVGNVRYGAHASDYARVGISKNVFYRLNRAVFDCLYNNMGREEAGVAFALLTGNSGGMDEGLLENVQRGGLAHIFAVSGLHIGIVYAAVYACLKRCGKYRFLPALAVAALYAGVCGFTVSAVRAVIMCGVLGLYRSFGRKTDFLQTISCAAIAILLFFPAQWFSVGFLLSFGAVVGLALFYGSFSKCFARLRLPRILCSYLGATLSVQLFTFPVLFDTFGYFPVLGFLLNLLIVPFVPALFLGLVLCMLAALIIPPAAAFFLAIPGGVISVFTVAMTATKLYALVTGFSLGAGGTVWLIACVALSQKFRLRKRAKLYLSALLAVVFSLIVVFENIVPSGCKITVYDQNGRSAALVQTKDCAVLVIDGDITLSACNEFLSHRFGGTLSAVVVLTEDEMAAINVGAFLKSNEVRARYECETGLQLTTVQFGDSFSYGTLSFRYEGAGKLLLFCEQLAVEMDFEHDCALAPDLFIGSGFGCLQYYLKSGTIKQESL